MARYIDADELLKELQEELGFETPMYTEEQNKYFNSGLRCAIRDVKKAPTADVVPKSEYDRLKKNFYELTQEAKGYLNRIYGIRADVAREIFEEIDTMIFGTIIPADCAIISIATLAELKKKYTESEDKP